MKFAVKLNMVKLRSFFRKIKKSNVLEEKPLVVVIPSYNNALWYQKNLDSIFNQKYSNYRIIYIDDASQDDTSFYVQGYVNSLGYESKLTLIKNEKRRGATANRYLGSHLAKDEEIVLILDGDDWFAQDYVFHIINSIYSNEDIWLTYGQFIRWPSGVEGQCKFLNQDYDFRSMDQWYTSALRTYYAWLFKKIKQSDLMLEDNFFDVAGDVAEMIPMLEMARGHIKFIDEILYVYNVKTNFNDFKINSEKQKKITQLIKSKQRYDNL